MEKFILIEVLKSFVSMETFILTGELRIDRRASFRQKRCVSMEEKHINERGSYRQNSFALTEDFCIDERASYRRKICVLMEHLGIELTEWMCIDGRTLYR